MNEKKIIISLVNSLTHDPHPPEKRPVTVNINIKIILNNDSNRHLEHRENDI